MNEEMMVMASVEAPVTAETEYENFTEVCENDACDELKALKAENDMLRKKLICAENSVPSEMAEDVFCLAQAYADRDGITFEAAAKAAMERLMGYARKSAAVTTGVRTENDRRVSDNGLRHAFGLK